MSGFPGWGEIGGGGGYSGGGGLPPNMPPTTDWAASRTSRISPPVDQDVLDFMQECLWWEENAERQGRVVLIDPEYTGRSTDVYEYFNLAWEKYKNDITSSTPLIFHFAPGIHVIRNAWRRQIGAWRAAIYVYNHTAGGVVVRGDGPESWVMGYYAETESWDDPPLLTRRPSPIVLAGASAYVHSLYIGHIVVGLGGQPAPGYSYPPKYWTMSHDALIHKYAADGIGKHWSLFDYFDPTYESDWEENYACESGSNSNILLVSNNNTPIKLYLRNCRIAHQWDLMHPSDSFETYTDYNILVVDSCRIEAYMQDKYDTTDATVAPNTTADGVGASRALKWYVTNTHWCGPGTMGRTVWQALNAQKGFEAHLPTRVWVEDCTFEYDNAPGDLSNATMVVFRNSERVGGNPQPTLEVLRNITVRWRNDRFRRRVNAGAPFSSNVPLTPGKAPRVSGEPTIRVMTGGIELLPAYSPEVHSGGVDVYIENVTIDGDLQYYNEMYVNSEKPADRYMAVGLFIGGWPCTSPEEGSIRCTDPPASAAWNVYVRGLNVNFANASGQFVEPVYFYNGYEGTDSVNVYWL